MKNSTYLTSVFGGFVFTLIWVSFRFFKRFGIIPCSLYVLFAIVALYFLIVRLRLPFNGKESTKWVYLIALIVSSLLLASSLQMNSLINSNYFINSGINYGNTDVDDAITLALNTGLNGEYPYTPKTWAGCPISPMPGALLLALPFHITGNAAAQGAFWFCMLFFALTYLMRDARTALWFWLLALVFSPKIIEGQMFQGSDHLTNATYVALSSILLIEVTRKHTHTWPSLLCSVLFGITLSSRFNFLLILPLIYSALIRLSGWRKATVLMGCTFLTYLIVTGPFYFYDPSSFSPLHITSIVEGASVLITILNKLSLVSAGGIALLLAIKSDNGKILVFLRNCFIIQIWIIMTQLIFSIVNNEGSVRIWMSVQYGFFFFPFGFLYFGTNLYRSLSGTNMKESHIIKAHHDGTINKGKKGVRERGQSFDIGANRK